MIALLAGCVVVPIQFPPDLFPPEDSGSFDTGGSGTVFGTLRESTLQVRCGPEESPGAAIRTNGWSEEVEAILVDESRGVTETHPMFRTQVDPGGSFEVYQLGPLGYDDFVAGVSTRMPCSEDAPSVSLALLSTGRTGVLVDCIAMGQRQTHLASALEQRGALAACRIIDAPF